jgi:hypothetical protein
MDDTQKTPTLDEMKAFYEEQLPFLEVQLRYATLKKEIQQADAERIEAIAKIAYLKGNMQNMAAAETEGTDQSPE